MCWLVLEGLLGGGVECVSWWRTRAVFSLSVYVGLL